MLLLVPAGLALLLQGPAGRPERIARPAIMLSAEQPPRAARLVSPIDDARIVATGDPVVVDLVWEMPPAEGTGHGQVEFFVEVVTPGQGGPRLVFASYAARSPVHVSLDRDPAQYAWRVTTVSRAAQQYALSEWGRFRVTEP